MTVERRRENTRGEINNLEKEEKCRKNTTKQKPKVQLTEEGAAACDQHPSSWQQASASKLHDRSRKHDAKVAFVFAIRVLHSRGSSFTTHVNYAFIQLLVTICPSGDPLCSLCDNPFVAKHCKSSNQSRQVRTRHTSTQIWPINRRTCNPRSSSKPISDRPSQRT